jgi:hypothetical protein
MLRGILHPLRFSWSAGILLATLVISTSLPTPAAAQPCFDVRVEFRGREATTLVGNVQFYRWTYRVYGAGCINRALGTFSLESCASMVISGASESSTDASDFAGGLVSSYLSTFEQVPMSTDYRQKWDFIGGNPVNKVNEYDEFSFIASGHITTIDWTAKGAPFVITGTTLGPTCAPVANQSTTWGAIKSRAR